jgi:hypothetical protein
MVMAEVTEWQAPHDVTKPTRDYEETTAARKAEAARREAVAAHDAAAAREAANRRRLVVFHQCFAKAKADGGAISQINVSCEFVANREAGFQLGEHFAH